ncbi:hypothetical protein GCM10027562_22340 [Arthrobacter pigmenti]
MLQAVELVTEIVGPIMVSVIHDGDDIAVGGPDAVVVALPQRDICRQIQIDNVIYPMFTGQSPQIRVAGTKSTGEKHQLDLNVLLPRDGPVHVLQPIGPSGRHQH